MTQKSNFQWWFWFLAILFIVVVIVFFIATLGTKNLGKTKDSREEILKKHKELQSLLNEKVALREKLTRRFKYTYLTVRILLVVLYGGAIYIGGYFLGFQSLEDFLAYYEFSIIILIVLNFITFGTVANFNDFISILQKKVENWVWVKHLNLPEEIKSISTKLSSVQNQP